jgi:DNA repair protein RecO (recombination protein O)
MPTFTSNAICLRLMDWSETSQIVVLLTEAEGKVSAVAKGAKRQTPSTLHKFSGGVELLTRGQAVVITKANVELANLIEWNLLDAHWHLRRDLAAYRLAMYAVDLAGHLLHDHDPHPATYRALERLLADLTDPVSHQAALLRFQWALVSDLGYRPTLDRDAETGEDLDEQASTFAFNPVAGGVVHDTGHADRWRMRKQTLDLLRALDADGEVAGQEDDALRRANRLLCSYFRALLDRQLPTMDAVLGG